MNDNVLEMGTAAAKQADEVKTLPGMYPLDWKTIAVKLGDGKFEHEMRRPSVDLLLERDVEMQSTIEIAKDGGYKLPDPTGDDDLNARYYDRLIESISGYPGEVPTMHKAAAFAGIYKREIYVDEDATAFDDQVAVIEEIGGDPPKFTVRHVFRQPTEDELRSYRRKMQTGEIKPGKRGRQVFVTRSNLKTAIEFYDKWIANVDGATVDGSPIIDARGIGSVDPLIKRTVVQTFAGFLLDALLD